MAEKGCEQHSWKEISDSMGLKNRRDAIIEYLRLKITEDMEKDFLQQQAKKLDE